MPMPPSGPVPGWNGQLPWNSPSAAPRPPMPAGQQPMGQPPAIPPQRPPQPPQGAPQAPLQGLPQLPGAPGGTPPAVLGAPANQPGSPPPGMPPQGLPPQMASGGRVPHIAHAMHGTRIMPRSAPTLNHVLQGAGLRRYNHGGQVHPVVLHPKPRHAYAQGGLVQAAGKVQDAGRFGDSKVVHLNDAEYRDLVSRHGAPHINPQTGLPEFFNLGKLLAAVAPIAALAIPGIGEALAPALMGLGLGATSAGVLSSALVGGAFGAGTAALGGSDPIKGALIGGVTGGVGAAFGPSISGGLQDLGIGSQTANALVNAGLGAGGAAAGGGNPLMGALEAGALSYAAPQVTAKIQGLGSIGSGSASTAPGGVTVSDLPPGSEASTGVIPPSALASDSNITPSQINAAGNAMSPAAPSAPSGTGAPATGNDSLISKALPALMLASLAGGLTSKKPTAAAPTPPGYLSQSLNPSTYAPQINQAALQAMINNPGLYASQGGPGYYMPGTTGFSFAKGGALQAAHRMSAPSPAAQAGRIKGAGDGQSDEVDAKLADGEHVLDSDFVGLLGNGSNDAGHRAIENWKADVRKKKRSAAPNKIPPKTGALASSFAAAQRSRK